LKAQQRKEGEAGARDQRVLEKGLSGEGVRGRAASGRREARHRVSWK
jgi:hypothetical protein